MRKYLEVLNRQISGPTLRRYYPLAGGRQQDAACPTDNSPCEVSENDDEVVITAGMSAGTTKKDIALDLIDPRTLEITCDKGCGNR